MKLSTCCSLIAVTLVSSTIASPRPRYPTTEPKAIAQPANDQQQHPLSTSDSDDVYTAVITDYNRFCFTTTLQIGSPPLTYHANVDIGWQDLFIPSSKCKSEACSYYTLYDSSRSSSYTPIDYYPVSVHYGGINTWGFASSDTVHLAGLTIQNQIFHEATSYLVGPWTRDDIIETTLGLSRLPYNSSELSTLNAPSIWSNIISQKLLKRNVFSIKLSKSPHFDGEIMFGGVNRDLFVGELQTVKVTNVTDDFDGDEEDDDWHSEMFKSGWQVPAHSLTFGPTIHGNLSNYTAIFITSFPFITLPVQLAEAIREICGAPEIGEPQFVDCEVRDKLPDMVVRLGVQGEVEVRISAWDYIAEIRDEDGEVYCALRWDDDEVRDDVPKHIVLGSPFLGGVYSVFDQDEGTISFAQLK